MANCNINHDRTLVVILNGWGNIPGIAMTWGMKQEATPSPGYSTVVEQLPAPSATSSG